MLILYCLVSLLVGTAVCMVAQKKHPWIVQVSYAATVVGCVITAAKISTIAPGVYVSVAIGLYSMTFLLTDFLGEVYNKATAMRAVYMGLIAELLVIFAVYFSIAVPAAPFWANGERYAEVLGAAPRIMVASVLAFVTAQVLDVSVFDWLKKRTSGKHLLLRNNMSTVVGQTTDSIVFYTVAFWGKVPNLLELIVVTCLVKYVIAAVDTPFLYFARHWAGRGDVDRPDREHPKSSA